MVLQVGGYGGTKKRVPNVMVEGSADTAEKKTYWFVLIFVIFV